MPFSFDEWDGSPESLPQEVRSKLEQAFTKPPAPEPSISLTSGITDDNLTVDGVRALLREHQVKAEIAELRKEYDDFDQILPSIQDKIKAGLSPRDAYKLATFDRQMQIAVAKATEEAQRKLEALQRNAETSSTTGSQTAPPSSSTGNKWDDDEAFKKQKAKLARMDAEEVYKFMQENDAFRERILKGH